VAVRSVALSIFGRLGRRTLTSWATPARLSQALTRCLIIVRSNSAKDSGHQEN